MTGGLYGRGKAPERACMAPDLWPATDRAIWRAAQAPADPFAAGGGICAGHAAISNRKTEKGYGRWLTWLALTGQLNAAMPPDERITPERVAAYAAHLAAIGNGSQTILARLQELGDMARVLAPAMSWSFIKRLASRVRARHVPVRDKRSRVTMSDELVTLGRRLMAGADHEPTSRLAALAFRDGLIIAFLAMRPLRRKNLAGLAIGASVLRVGDGWVLDIPPEATKTRQPIDHRWPDVLAPALETYLGVHRPVLAVLRNRWTAPVGDALWVSSHGSPMTEMALYDTIRSRTKAGLGVASNPHLFRDNAATTMALADPEHVRLAAPLLGHRTTATTERYYQQAQSLEAHRQFQKVIGCTRSGRTRSSL